MKLRRGNDITFFWTIVMSGGGVLSSFHPRLFLNSSTTGRKEVHDFSIDGNVVSWTFRGRDQNILGSYSLTLVGNNDEDGMWTIDTCNIVELVAHSCQEKNDLPCGVRAIRLNITSCVDYINGSVTVNNSYSVLTEKPRINGVTLDGDLSWEDLGLPSGSAVTEVMTEDDEEELWNVLSNASGRVVCRTPHGLSDGIVYRSLDGYRIELSYYEGMDMRIIILEKTDELVSRSDEYVRYV